MSSSPANLEANPAGAGDCGALRTDILGLFLQLLPVDFVTSALQEAKVRENNRIYTSTVVMWLMVSQRLHPQGTLGAAVLELLRNPPASFWKKPCKRLKRAAEGGPQLSHHTGAYNQARQDLDLAVVEQSCDHVFEQLIAAAQPEVSESRWSAFFVDGTAVRLSYTKELAQAYPPASNQHGESHSPLIRMLVAHDLYTGLAMRPEWGPMYGPEAVSEQGLLQQAIQRLPTGAVVVADCNFGVFSVAYAADQQNHPVVLRLMPVRAQHLAGGPLRDGMDQRIVWKPSRDDRRNHRKLHADAAVEGRLIVRQVEPSNGAKPFLLSLFVTLADAAEELVELYGQRWKIETDLRSLKGTLRLEELTCTTVSMVAKEIELAMLSYNLVRAVMYTTARKAGLEPRAFSFTQVRNVLEAYLPEIAATRDETRARRLSEDMLYYLQRCKLPQRKRPAYPRAVWPKPKTYPARHRGAECSGSI